MYTYELITKRWCLVLGYKNYSVMFGVYSVFVLVVLRSNANNEYANLPHLPPHPSP